MRPEIEARLIAAEEEGDKALAQIDEAIEHAKRFAASAPKIELSDEDTAVHRLAHAVKLAEDLRKV